VEAKTDLVQGLRFLVPVPELLGYLQQALLGFDGGTELAQQEMHRPFARVDRHPGCRFHRLPKPLTHVQRPAIVLAGFLVCIGLLRLLPGFDQILQRLLPHLPALVMIGEHLIGLRQAFGV
jgi:hypothetical protein